MQQERQWGVLIKLLLPWKSNNYYIFVCVCVCMWVSVLACVHMCVALLMYHAMHHHIVICSLSGSTIFFDIIS
jgi:hypothetical protein